MLIAPAYAKHQALDVRAVAATALSTVAVTTSADRVDGDTSSVGSLNSTPGADGRISLREALLAANATPTSTLALTITFSIPTSDAGYVGASDTWRLAVGDGSGQALPPLARGMVRLLGPARAAQAAPHILLDGSNVYEADGANVGLDIQSAENVLRDLALINFNDNAILLGGAAAHHNQVAGCAVGIDLRAGAAQQIGLGGVGLQGGAHDNLIGGAAALDRNNISATLYSGGVWISGADTAYNTVAGNWIGLDMAGAAALPNIWAGVYIADGAHDNLIGGAGQGNVISGNDNGIFISEGAWANQVSANLIGPLPDGASALGNRDTGIFIDQGAHDNRVGGTTAAERNIISGNGQPETSYGQGIVIDGANSDNNWVQGNYIGVDQSGLAPLGNRRQGLLISHGAQGNQIGGSESGAGNLIASNGSGGIRLDTAYNHVVGNLIGIGADRSTSMPNLGNGVRVYGSDNTIGPDNLIAFNRRSGIMVSGSGTLILDNTLQQNARSGVCVAATKAQILNNTISANGGVPDTVPECNIQGGVVITGTGATEVMTNTIQDNIGMGITVRSGVGNRLLANSISDNTMGGIALLAGGNQNIPSPSLAQHDDSTVEGTSCSACYVELFADEHSQGRLRIGAGTADAAGTFQIVLAGGAQGLAYITATATDAAGNTSAFAPPLIWNAANSQSLRTYIPLISR